MKCFYDFHIHTALSPCGDDDMTPNNIINMSILKGLDAVAITDHNSALNVRACFECGSKAGITVLPGMEIETSEEVHITALFDNPDSAEELGRIVSERLPSVKNRVDIFGSQLVIDSDDKIIQEVEKLLSTAAGMDVYEAVKTIRNLGGVAIPAHVDKSSYSIISNLGFIPQDLDFTTVEVKNPQKVPELLETQQNFKYKLIHNSDAHFLWDIHERVHFLDIPTKNAATIIDYLVRK